MKAGRVRIAFWALLLGVLTFGSSVCLAGEIIWPYFEFPPLHYMEHGELKGVEPALVEAMTKRLPQYEHTRLPSPPKRSLRLARRGENICFAGVLKTAEREEYLHYSLPMRLVPPMVAVVRADDDAAYGDPFPLRRSLEEGVTIGLIKGSNIGALQEIIDEHVKAYGAQTIHYVHTMDSVERQFRLLLAGRVQALLLTLPQLAYESRRLGVDSHDLTVLPVLEDQQYIVGHVACTGNEWGKQVIRDINDVLAGIVPTAEYRDLFLPWINEALQPEFLERYEALLAVPARKHAAVAANGGK